MAGRLAPGTRAPGSLRRFGSDTSPVGWTSGMAGSSSPSTGRSRIAMRSGHSSIKPERSFDRPAIAIWFSAPGKSGVSSASTISTAGLPLSSTTPRLELRFWSGTDSGTDHFTTRSATADSALRRRSRRSWLSPGRPPSTSWRSWSGRSMATCFPLELCSGEFEPLVPGTCSGLTRTGGLKNSRITIRRTWSIPRYTPSMQPGRRRSSWTSWSPH